MKKISFLLLFLVIFQINLSSQSCLPEGIVFEYQEEIDSFQVNYPGCTRIEGNVNIWGSDITNLDGLSVISHIGGMLFIHNCFDLSDLSGLQNIDTIEVNLVLQSNNNLTSLNGLEGLAYVGGNVDIFNNTSLNDLTGLQNLMYVSGFLSIVVTGSLQNLAGLENLVTIGDDLIISGNDAMESLEGMENLVSIGDRLEISYNTSLTSLAGLDNLDQTSIMDLYVYENLSLSTCSEPFICNYLANPAGSVNIYHNAQGCNNPSEVAGSCGITLSCLPFGNYYFLSQADIDNFQSNYPDCADLQGNVSISGSDITSLDGLNILTSIAGDTRIIENNALSSLAGLENLHKIGGFLDIIMNESLSSITGLENLDSTGNFLRLQANNVLVDLTGFEGLTFIEGSLEIVGNGSLKNCFGLNNLHHIKEYLVIYDNNAMTELKGLNNIDTIGAWIDIYWNNSLVSLAALENTKLTRGLDIDNNQFLASLSGLDNLDPDSLNWLKISNNSLLSDCDVRSICDYLDGADTTADIHSNATGCYNREEVEAACWIGMPENQMNNLCSLFPDPVRSFATFHLQINDPGNVKIDIFNNTGQELETILDEYLPAGSHFISWNAHNLPPGLYFYRISTIGNRQPVMGKLIKL